MKYTAEHKGFILYIEEVQEEGKGICFEGKCKEIDFIQEEYYNSGFWKLLGDFQFVVERNLTPRFLHSESYRNGMTSWVFLVDEDEMVEDSKILIRLSYSDLKNLRDELNSYLGD